MEPLGESRPPTMLNPRLFFLDPLENVTSQMAVDRDRERRKCPSTRSPDEDGVVAAAEVEASLSRRLTIGFLLIGAGDVDVMDCWT